MKKMSRRRPAQSIMNYARAVANGSMSTRQAVVIAQPRTQAQVARKRRQRNRRRMRNMQNGGMAFTRTNGNVTTISETDGRKITGTQIDNNLGGWAIGPNTSMGKTWTSETHGNKIARNLKIPVGTTEAGRLAAMKALHPAADLGPQRWPDKSADNTVAMQNTDAWLVGAPDGGEANTPWSVIIWTTPFIDCPIIIHRVNGGPNFADVNNEMNSTNTVVWPEKNLYQVFYSSQWDNSAERHPGHDWQTARLTARSVTIDLIANATNNQGVVYSGQFSPNLKLLPEVGGPQFVGIASVLAQMIRALKIDKKDLIVPVTNREGEKLVDLIDTLTSRIPKRIADQAVTDDGDDVDSVGKVADAPSGGQSGYRTVFQDWPYSIEQVAQMDPKGYTAKACEGVYVPLRHASDTLEYAETSVESYLSARVPHVSNNQTTQVNVLLSNGWTMSASIFGGLDRNSFLNIKAISALELTARSDSQMAKFVEEAPPLDKLAIDQTRRAMAMLPTAFPASYNFLGTIVEYIAEALAASRIPVISQVAEGAVSLNKRFNKAGTSYLDGIF